MPNKLFKNYQYDHFVSTRQAGSYIAYTFTKFLDDYCDGTPMEFFYFIYEHGDKVYTIISSYHVDFILYLCILNIVLYEISRKKAVSNWKWANL